MTDAEMRAYVAAALEHESKHPETCFDNMASAALSALGQLGRLTSSREEEEPAPCDDCKLPVVADLIIPCDAWRAISPTGDLGGYLCPNCILYKLRAAKIVCDGAIFSPNINAVSAIEMSNARRVENIELALEGFRNRWGAALDDRIAEGGIDPHRPDEAVSDA